MSKSTRPGQTTSLWINAGQTLAKDPKARIVCPNCGLGVLQVHDEPISNGERIERWMRCDYCGVANTLLLRSDAAACRSTSDNARPGAANEKLPKESSEPPTDWNDLDAVDRLVRDAVVQNRDVKKSRDR